MKTLKRTWLHWGTRSLLGAGIAASIFGSALAQTRDPHVDQLTLQLTKSGTGILGVQIARQDQERILKENAGVLTLSFSEKEGKVEFSDRGEGVDAKANDGVFSAEVPVNFDLLQRLNAEASKKKNRVITRFNPSTREVIGKEELSSTPIDLEALKAGRVIRLPNLGEFGPFETLGATPADVDWQKSLMITSIPVIEDPQRTNNPCQAIGTNNPLKSWTFGHLMTEMSQGSGFTPSQFTERWLQHWLTQQTVFDSSGAVILDSINNNAASAMTNRVINPWRARSGGGALNLSIAPFRLQAIFYRPDLANSSTYGGGGGRRGPLTGGELRFVFGLMEVRDANNNGVATDVGDTCRPLEFAVIFEYGVPTNTCETIKTWANNWVNLSNLLPGSPAYNGALQTLTESVVTAGANPAKPNQNAINQVRTNEIELTGIWQFREFRLPPPSNGPLRQKPVVANPREHQAAFTSTGSTPTPINLNGTPLFLSEVQTNTTAINNGTYSFPEFSSGLPFQGGASSYNFGTFWDHPGLTTAPELEARFKFSLNTCSACHTGETDTTFYHVRPFGPGSPPALSDFLTMQPWNVVDNRGIPRSFDEIGNRTQALVSLANQSCSIRGGIPFPAQLLRTPLLNVH